jgi:Flp pilus assembly protein TadG
MAYKHSLLRRLRQHLRELCAENAANVAVIFALAVVPVAGLVGAAVDYSRGNAAKTAMQASADATALILAKTIAAAGPGGLNSTQINQKAYDNFAALLNASTQVMGLQVSTDYSSTSTSTVAVNATGSVKTDFMGLFGISKLSVAVHAQSAWGGGAKLQVALALDNTGSMFEYNKIGSLKTATHALLTQLQNAASNPNDVNVAIVPFAREVNVGAALSNNPWIDWSDWDATNGSDTNTQTCTKVIGKKGKPTNKCVNSTTWVPAAHTTWNGCVADRDQDYDTTNASPNPADKNLPASAASTLFPAEQSPWCPVQLTGLTNNWSALNGLVDQMTPNGNTNQAIGLAWAWQALTQGPPLNAPGKSAGMQQIIILLTDGLNTEDRWYSDQASIDARQIILCNNIKAAGITLYTIQVNINRMDPVSTLLQQCASKPEYFYLLTTAGEIATVFNQIGTNISALRIAR